MTLELYPLPIRTIFDQPHIRCNNWQQKRAQAVKSVLMGAETGMPLHCHTNSLTLSTVTFPNSNDIPRVTCSAANWLDLNNSHSLFSHLHLVTSFRSHDCPGVDPASNINEYQDHFLGVKMAGAYGWQPHHHPVPLSRNLGTLISWNPLGHSRPVAELIYT